MSGSQTTLIWLLVIAIATTILAWEYWIYWFIFPFTVLIWLLVDCMFGQYNGFMFEPNLHYWKEANEEEY
jgi:hypothetical protein